MQGQLVNETANSSVWAKTLENGAVAVVLLNLGDAKATISTDLTAVGITAGATVHVHDLWSNVTLGTHTGSFSAELESHASCFVTMTVSQNRPA